MTLSLINTAIGFLLMATLISPTSCQSKNLKIITVTGEMPASEMGITLTHEHVLVDFAMIDSVGTHPYNRDSVISKVLPFFEELASFKVATFVECTPVYLGRDPQLLAALSRKSGIRILTNTGWYAADHERHIPNKIKEMSAEEIAAIWIEEAKNGIENTGIKPGFIKIGINTIELSETDKKLVAAACLTHLETGLTIMSHTGPAAAALAQLQILKQYGVDPSAFIWTHAMNERSNEKIREVALTGCWVAFDGIHENIASLTRSKDLLDFMKSSNLLNRILLSQDAGWYDPAKPGGGDIRPYTAIFKSLIPILRNNGFTREEVDQMIVKNPAVAFGVRIRKIAE